MTNKQKPTANNNQRMYIGGGLIAVIVMVALLFTNQGNNDANDNEVPTDDNAVSTFVDNSVAYESQGQRHLGAGEVASEPYNSNPPTSGPHASTWAPTDVYLEIIADIFMIHNLEHGHIWLSYRDADDQEAIDLLTELQSELPQWVVVTHRPENDTRIAAAAWTRLLTLDEVDEEQLLGFINQYRNRAPESIPG